MKITNKNKNKKNVKTSVFVKKKKKKIVGTISLEAHLCVLKNL